MSKVFFTFQPFYGKGYIIFYTYDDADAVCISDQSIVKKISYAR